MILGLRAFLRIDAQSHRRLGIVGSQDQLPVFGMVFLQPCNPPCGVVPDGHRVAIRGRDQCIALAQKAAQAAVDKARLRTRSAALGHLHRLIDQREWWVRRMGLIPGQSQGCVQQGADLGCRRAGYQLLLQCLGAPQIAQDLKQQSLHARAQTLRHLRQHRLAGLPTQNAMQGLRNGFQLLPQRRSSVRGLAGTGIFWSRGGGRHEIQKPNQS